jgi:FtsP/CotA-like multicopper oxidase with cupredoxin domain
MCGRTVFHILPAILLTAGVAHSQLGEHPCPRPHVGALAIPPNDLYSSGGLLKVEFSFQTYTDIHGRKFYCYIAGDGSQSPTLRVKRGDEVVLTLKNEIPAAGAGIHAFHDMRVQGPCGSGTITASTTNLHFHGLSIRPSCHQDDVLSTLVQPSESGYEYRFKIPANQPPGLYWYHPHPHGFSEAQVLGGASGALIVEGIERTKPEVAGLPERVIVLRDQISAETSPDSGEPGGPEASKDISVNFVPILHPENAPAAMVAKPNQREFWRILNAAADTYFDLQVLTGPSLREALAPLPLELVAMDGVPSAQDPASGRKDILLPPGTRAELILTTPPEGVFARLATLRYDTGPDGETTPSRIIANLFSSSEAPASPSIMPDPGAAPPRQFAGLLNVPAVRERKLYFSEKRRDPGNPKSPMIYFITAEGEQPRVFDMNFTKPDVTVRQGTVEDWVIENRATEAHAFHIHQLHFQVIERDGQTVNEPLLRDTIDLPYWDGKSIVYPSVKLRMDFRDPNIIGTFLFHCHILEHEDGGMMGSIRVTPRGAGN